MLKLLILLMTARGEGRFPPSCFWIYGGKSTDKTDKTSRYPVNVTVTERLAIGKAMEEELAGRVGNPNLRINVEKFPPLETGKSRDLGAQVAQVAQKGEAL